MTDVQKWQWMINYCIDHKLPSAQSWAWERAAEAYRLWLLEQTSY